MDAILPEWKMRCAHGPEWKPCFPGRATARNRVYPVKVHGDGTWGDVNACMAARRRIIYQGTRWGDAWGADPGRRELEILERRQDKAAFARPPCIPPGRKRGAQRACACCSVPLS
jgi:hypothetical protein